MPRAQHDPRLGEPEALVQVRERVQLDRRSLPGALDLAPQLQRKPRRLSGVPRDDLIVEIVQRAHIRDPRIMFNRTASQVP